MKIHPAVLYILFFIVSSCANRVTPTGGEKDIAPPVLVNAEPKNFTTNLTVKKININFDEYIQLKDANQQIIVSPLMEPAATFSVKKKTLTIDLPDTLKTNTTYTINFGGSIADIHEGNEFPYQYVFSTGAVLDSLSITGRALDALTQTGKKGVKILLYSSDDDSLPFKHRPDYFALTDDAGNFKISNIGSGVYSIVASDDKNANYINDGLQNEAISVSRKVNVPDTSVIALDYFTEPAAKAFIKNISAVAKGRWDIFFNRRLTSPSLKATKNTDVFMHEWNSSIDTLMIWSSDSLTDSLTVLISEAGTPADTAYIRLKTKSASSVSGRGGAAKVFPFVENSNTLPALIAGADVVLKFINPVISIDTSKILFTEDSIVKKYIYTFRDSLKRDFHLKYNWQEEKKYQLKFLPGAVTDFNGRKNDTLVYDFAGKKIAETGSIEFNISGIDTGSWILQLLTPEFNVITELQTDSAGKYILNFLEPQKLKARLIRDENKNGRWDPGNYFSKNEPEKIYYYPGEIQSRANWELELEWKIEIINSKL
ncbi:MAG: Ig-like domain-containing protein [Bacteroidota bacterium]